MKFNAEEPQLSEHFMRGITDFFHKMLERGSIVEVTITDHADYMTIQDTS